jgi:hypothetical protein
LEAHYAESLHLEGLATLDLLYAFFGEGAPAKRVCGTTDDGADRIAVSLKITLDGLLEETVEVVIVDSG